MAESSKPAEAQEKRDYDESKAQLSTKSGSDSSGSGGRESPLSWRRRDQPLSWRQRDQSSSWRQPHSQWNRKETRRNEPGRRRGILSRNTGSSDEGTGEDAEATKKKSTFDLKGNPPVRKNVGSKGRCIPLIVNHVEILLDKSQTCFYMYHIHVGLPRPKEDETLSRKLRQLLNACLTREKRRLIITEKLLKEDIFKDILPAFDGSQQIYTRRRLPIPPEGQSFEYQVVINDKEEKPSPVEVVVKEVKVIETGVLHSYVSREFEGPEGSLLDAPHDPLRIINSVFRAAFEAAGFVSMGSTVIDTSRAFQLSCGPFDVHEGAFFSVRPQRWSIRLIVDKSQAVLHQPMSLVDYVYSWRSSHQVPKKQKFFERWEIRAMEAELKGLRVIANHFRSTSGKQYSRKFTIAGLSRLSASELVIPELDLTVAAYTRLTHDVNLRYPHWPCVCTDWTRHMMFPMEVLTLAPFQRAPNEGRGVSSEILRSTAIPTYERKQQIEKIANSLKANKVIMEFLQKQCINVNPKLCQVKGRVLQSPKVFSANGPIPLSSESPGKWSLRNQVLSLAVNFSALFVLNLSKCSADQVQKFISMLLNVGRKMGMKIPDPREIRNLKWHYQRVENFFRDIKAKLSADQLKSAIVIVILPYESEAYGIIKQFGDINFGISTQCVYDAKVSNSSLQIVSNIVLKMNAKLNGINWKVNICEGLENPINEAFIVFGADVTHPAQTGSRKINKSIAALVASSDRAALRYSAVVRMQKTVRSERSKSVVEVIGDLAIMTKLQLRNFYRRTGLKPASIIFYRDGVSDGQFREVIEHEVAAIQEACRSLQEDYQPGITFIIVQKRHRTRLFPEKSQDAIGWSKNIPAGTVVDSDIVHPRSFDFFLCSHEGCQGTSRPTHYHVLWDDNNWGSDDLQNFTFYLCHTYMRCTRSVSHPAPTFYAHLAAFRARTTYGELDMNEMDSEVSSLCSRVEQLPVSSAEDITPLLADRQYWI